MRVSKFLLTTGSGVQVHLPLINAKPSDQFIVKDITGLGPPDAGVIIKQTLRQGGIPRGRNPQARELVIRVGLTPNYSKGQTASDLRQMLYGLLSPDGLESTDTLFFSVLDENNKLWAKTDGLVNRIEIVPFSKDPEVQITMNCFEPYFTGNVVDVPVASISRSKPVIVNPGTAPTGFRIELSFPASDSKRRWFLQNPQHTKRFGVDGNPNNLFAQDDRLVVDTRFGSRRVTRVRSGTPTQYLNLLPYLETDSTWLQLQPGRNEFEAPLSETGYTITRLYFFPKYWGI